MPETGVLVSHAPEGVDPEVFRARVFAGVAERVAELARRAQAEGRSYLGVDGLRRLQPFSRPRTRPKRRDGRAVERRPTLLGSSDEETRDMIAAEVAFRERYAAALTRLRRRAADAVFPAGTFLLWRFFGALREAYEPSELALRTRT